MGVCTQAGKASGMATATRTIRAAESIWALLDAEAKRREVSPNALAAELLGAALGGADASISRPPAPKASPKPPAARVEAPKAARIERAREAVEARGAAVMVGRGVSVAAAMERAGVERWDGRSKRPAYQKGQAGQGKAKRR